MSRRVPTNLNGYGFTVLEVIISLVIAGLLMSAIGMVMAQVVQNDVMLQDVQGSSGREAALRRLLHRDMQGVQRPLTPEVRGFHLTTSHNMLLDGPLPVMVSWSFEAGRIRRLESSEDISYTLDQTLATGLQSWSMEILDITKGRWLKLQGLPLSKLQLRIGAIKLVLEFAEERIEILERVPYAWIKTEED